MENRLVCGLILSPKMKTCWKHIDILSIYFPPRNLKSGAVVWIRHSSHRCPLLLNHSHRGHTNALVWLAYPRICEIVLVTWASKSLYRCAVPFRVNLSATERFLLDKWFCDRFRVSSGCELWYIRPIKWRHREASPDDGEEGRVWKRGSKETSR